MYQDVYYIDKSTDTSADLLLTYGVGYLLAHILRDNNVDPTVRVKDTGVGFEIHLNVTIQESYLEIPWFCDLPFIATKSKQPSKDWTGGVILYDKERERKSDYRLARKQLPKEAWNDPNHPTRANLPKPPHPDLEFFEMVNQMQSITAYVQVLTAWETGRVCFQEMLQIVLRLFASPGNDVQTAQDAWKHLQNAHQTKAKVSVTPVQSINPAMGKGVNRAKMDGATNFGKSESFWMLEYLKFLGMLKAGVPRIVKATSPDGPRDRKTYVLHPCNITIQTHEKIFSDFKKAMWADTAVKMDVLAALRYTHVFLAQWEAGQHVDEFFGDQPGDYVQGLAVAFYKDLGSAVALINLSEIALPRWIETINTAKEAQDYKLLIEEHLWIIRRLEERKAEEYNLLQTYRDFLSGHDIDAFLRFTAGFSNLVMARLAQNQSFQFSIPNLEVLMDAHDKKLKPIYKDPGFQNIAAAIRRSTVIPQRQKAKGNKAFPYKPRYGLGAELMRNAAYPQKFMFALSNFAHDYSQEVQRVFERFDGNPPKEFRRTQITDADLQHIMHLIDKYGSELIAGLLVAFGYARSVTGREQDDSQDDNADDADNDFE